MGAVRREATSSCSRNTKLTPTVQSGHQFPRKRAKLIEAGQIRPQIKAKIGRFQEAAVAASSSTVHSRGR